jgi:hypothetical protein
MGRGSGGGCATWQWDSPSHSNLVGLEILAQWKILDPGLVRIYYSESVIAKLTLFRAQRLAA